VSKITIVQPVSRYQNSKTYLYFTESRDSECQGHQLGQTDNHASTHHSVFLQARCPSCHPTKQRQSTEGTKGYKEIIGDESVPEIIK